MATKGFNKLITKGKSIFGGNNSNAAQDPRELTSASREREKNLQSKLESLLHDIEYSPEFKLSKDKIQEFKIPVRIARFIKALETPLVTETNEADLDKHIEGFVDALRKALRLGYTNSAYWSSLALYHSLECLHVAVDEFDKEFSEMLYTRKLEYAETLNTIIRNANKQDELDATISSDEKEYNRWMKERRDLKAEYDALKTNAKGIDLINRTRNHFSSPSEMAEDEVALYNKISRIHELDGLLATKVRIRNANIAMYKTVTLAIQQANDKLRQKPSVDDKLLAGKMAVVNERFLKNLDERIGTTLSIMKEMDEYTDKVAAVTQRLEKAMALRLSRTVDQLDTEAMRESLLRKESAEMAARIAANQRELQRQEDLLNNYAQELEEQTEAETNTVTEIESETETQVEQVYEVETEYC